MISFRSIFNFNNLTFLIAIYFLYSIVYRWYHILNPLAGVEVNEDEDKVIPLWEESQSFSLICFLSSSPRFHSFSLSQLEEKEKILLRVDHLKFQNDETNHQVHELNHVKVDFNLVDNAYLDKNNSQIKSYVVSDLIWNSIRNNGTMAYLHALTVRHGDDGEPPDAITPDTLHLGQGGYGVVNLVKYDAIPAYFRHRYLLSDFGFEGFGTPDDMEKAALASDTVISYWKPEVAVRLVTDFTEYPVSHVPLSISRNIVHPKYTVPKNHRRINSGVPHQRYYKPPFHVDEIGLTSDKYVPLNETVRSLPLTLSFEPMSVQRWLLMDTMQKSLQMNKESLGFSDKDLDDVRRLISDTSVYLLGLTLLASVLHLLFEFLAFQSDVSFWQENKSLTGLSVRTLVTDLISQFVIFLFLLDSETSLLVTIPAAISILIQMWKVWKATGVTIRGGSVVMTRIESETEEEANDGEVFNKTKKSDDSDRKLADNLASVTREADRIALFYLGFLFFPIVLGFTFFTLIMQKHMSWYSWIITTLTTCVYTGGFVLMCPQLFINHKLKSVAHLPWKLLCFRFVNTFIDDLFVFIIKMPTMHRLSAFRDDLVFFVYMYQRHIYRVDDSRPSEK